MKLLVRTDFTDTADALGFSHMVRQRAWPNHPAVTYTGDRAYMYGVIEHPTNGTIALKIPDNAIGYLTEDEQADLVDWTADWQPEEAL